jgi:hypothetical protein
MSIKKALLYGFSIAALFIITTLVFGHLWAFIILISTAFIGIAVSTIRDSKKTYIDNHNTD